MLSTFSNLVHQTAFSNLTIGNLIMVLVALILMYLAIAKQYEPLLFAYIPRSRRANGLRSADRESQELSARGGRAVRCIRRILPCNDDRLQR